MNSATAEPLPDPEPPRDILFLPQLRRNQGVRRGPRAAARRGSRAPFIAELLAAY